MTRETGIAHIVGNVGKIDADTGPTPVGFDPRTFSLIANGSSVYFWRVGSDPSWAARVVLVSTVEALVDAATPRAGFTYRAEALVRDEASRFFAEAQFAPRPELAEAHLDFAREKMSQVAVTFAHRSSPIGATVVRDLWSVSGKFAGLVEG